MSTPWLKALRGFGMQSVLPQYRVCPGLPSFILYGTYSHPVRYGARMALKVEPAAQDRFPVVDEYKFLIRRFEKFVSRFDLIGITFYQLQLVAALALHFYSNLKKVQPGCNPTAWKISTVKPVLLTWRHLLCGRKVRQTPSLLQTNLRQCNIESASSEARSGSGAHYS